MDPTTGGIILGVVIALGAFLYIRSRRRKRGSGGSAGGAGPGTGGNYPPSQQQ